MKTVKMKYKPYLSYYLMIITALILSSGFFYMKFLRTRLPRNIPFQLTLSSFLVLLGFCLMYLYIIRNLIRPKQSFANYSFIIFFRKPIQYILTSLDLLDSKIKNNSLIKPYYKRLIEHRLPIILEFGTIERVILYYAFKLFPGYILLFILITDVFLLHHIKIFYYFLFLGILPLSYEYFRYSLSQLKEEYLQHLESKYDLIVIQDENSIHKPFSERNPKAIYHDQHVSIKEYFDIKVKHLMTEYMNYKEEDSETEEITYTGHAYSKSNIYEQYENENNKDVLTENDYNILQEDFKELEPRLLGLMEYLILNEKTNKMFFIKPLRIIMYLLYFIVWSYILYKSLHTLPENLIWIKYDMIILSNTPLYMKQIILGLITKMITILTIVYLGYYYRK